MSINPFAGTLLVKESAFLTNGQNIIYVFSPGRFYGSIVAKMVLSEFILHYDLKLVDSGASRSFLPWGFGIVPNPMTRLLLRKRME